MSERVQAHQQQLVTAFEPWTVGGPLSASSARGNTVRSAYDADTYARLVALKNRYDSRNLLRINRNIPPIPGTSAVL